MSLVSVEDVHLWYEERGGGLGVLALEGINLSIHEGEFVVALGASGCGKTSLLNLMAGFLFPSQGSIKVKGEPVTQPGVDRGVVFQKHALMPWLSVQDNVEFGLKLRKVAKEERANAALQALEQVGLSSFASSYIYQLSGGMQQRVGMARALANDPDILLMDEPLGALEAITRSEVQEVILRVWDATHKTIFMITHSIEEAILLATRLIIMTPRPGRIVNSYDLNFSSRVLEGESVKEIKRSPEFVQLKDEILDTVEAHH